jgi:formate hydrogenlyase subunit 6/NADH:ubiquinone oxidoreductase subunit I
MPGDVFDRILRPLRRRIVTSGYPDQPAELAPAARGLPELDPARCDSSGTCAEVCPTRAITLSDGTWELDAGACIFCAACARACPRDAIRIGHRIELAVLDRRDLIVRHAVQDRS